MIFFEEAALRLKQQLGVTQDRDVAGALNMTPRAWAGRKKNNSFPDADLYALAAKRPELSIDVNYVLTGTSTKEAAAIAVGNVPSRIRELRLRLGKTPVEFAAHWGIGEQQLMQIESGERLPSADLMKRLISIYPDEDPAWLLGQEPPKLEQVGGELTSQEMILIANYRASSAEGKEALQHQAGFFASYHLKHLMD